MNSPSDKECDLPQPEAPSTLENKTGLSEQRTTPPKGNKWRTKREGVPVPTLSPKPNNTTTVGTWKEWWVCQKMVLQGPWRAWGSILSKFPTLTQPCQWCVLHSGGGQSQRPSQDKGTFGPLPWVCTETASALGSWIGLGSQWRREMDEPILDIIFPPGQKLLAMKLLGWMTSYVTHSREAEVN